MTSFWSSIHALRGLAALLVVIHHIPQYLGKKIANYPFEFEIGAIGVDVFFAISGFVMYHTASKPGLSPSDFIHDRFKRVLPIYWLITILLGGSTILIPSIFPSFHPSITDISKSVLFIPIYSESGMIRPVLAMGWTLHYEMLFYLTTGLSLALTGKRINPALLATTTLAIASLVLLITDPNYKSSASQLIAPLVVEFLFGALIAHILNIKNKAQQHTPEGILFIASGTLLVMSNPHAYNSIDLDRLASWGIGSAFIVLGLTLMEKRVQSAINAINPIKAFLYKLGDSSYALYLTHGLSFSISLKLSTLLNLSNWLSISLLSLFNAIALGYFTHIAIEKPVATALKKKKT